MGLASWRLFEALEAGGEPGWGTLSCSPSSRDVCLGSRVRRSVKIAAAGAEGGEGGD